MKRVLVLALQLTLLLNICGCGGGSSNTGFGSSSNGEVTATITANHATVSLGQSIVLNWSSTNASSCLATSAPPENDWTALVGTNGSAIVSPAAFGGEIYSLTCTGVSGSGATASTSIAVNSAASGLVNGAVNTTSPSTFWLGNSCVLDGQTISSLTVLGAPGQNSGVFYENDLAAGGVIGSAGGRNANWTATADGTGMLMNYTTAQCSRTPLLPVPVSIVNISGSAATGKFSAQLVDQKGIVASCSFVLAMPHGFGTVCF